MKRIVQVLVSLVATLPLHGQSKLMISSGANLKTQNGAYIVLNSTSLINNGVIQPAPGSGTYTFSGSNTDSISGNGTMQFDRIFLSKSQTSSLILQSNILVDSEFYFAAGRLDLRGQIMDLNGTGKLSNESEQSRAFTTGPGYIQTTRTLSAPSSLNVANLGLLLTSTSNMGITIIRRGHQTFNVSSGIPSVSRYFDVIPANNNNLKATLRFKYFNAETNGLNEATLGLWKSNYNLNWVVNGTDAKDTVLNYVERGNNNKLQRYTLSTSIPPSITCPANITTNADQGKCTSTVPFAATATGVPTPTIIYTVGGTTITSPFAFPRGTSTVTATATDGLNVATCTFTVTVIDNQGPVITCPANVFYCYQNTSQYTVPPLSATDNCGIASISYAITGSTTRNGTGNNASGTFNPGVSTIKWNVTDLSGNVSTCQTMVQVNPPLNLNIPNVYSVNPGGQPNTIYLGYGPSSLKLTAQASGGSPYQKPYRYSYKWTNSGTIISTDSTVIVNPAIPGMYNYTITITDSLGCTSSVNKQIRVRDIRCGNNKVVVCSNGSSICVGTSGNFATNLSNGTYVLDSCITSFVTLRTDAVRAPKGQADLQLNVFPNPTAHIFNIVVESTNLNEKIRLRILDVLGRVIETRNGLHSGQILKLGGNLIPGTYIIEAIQKNKTKAIKVVKIPD